MADYPVTPLTPPLTEQEIIRRQKLQALLDAGQNPYLITKFNVTHHSSDIVDHFDQLEGQTVSIAGRMTSRRVMGKASFAHLLDGEGDVQIYVKRDDVGDESYAAFKQDDLGDVLGVTGTVFRTQTGEVSIHSQRWQGRYSPYIVSISLSGSSLPIIPALLITLLLLIS